MRSSQRPHPSTHNTHTDSLAAVYGERHYARFYALETIARVPYFAYTSVLHLYEARSWVYEMAAAYRSIGSPILS